MAYKSQNGWPASPNLKIRPLVVAGESFAPGILDNDDVYVVLRYVAEQVHKRVERIYAPGWHTADDWGFYFRPNANNPDELSNHSSGTAIDYNSTRHPNGVPTLRTFTAAQVEEVHRILREVDNVVRWGGDYQRTPDSMHFEINAGPDAVRRVANKLRAQNVVYPKVGAADAVFQNVKVGRNATIEAALDALFSGRPTVGGLLECGGNWPGIRRWAKEHGYSIYTGRVGDDISSNGALLVKHNSGVKDHGYTTIATPWKGPHGKWINGRTAYWVDLVLGGEETRVFLDHFPWGYGKVAVNSPAYIQYARLQRRWASFHVKDRNLLIMQDGNLSATSRLPYSPRGTSNKIDAKIIASHNVDQIMWRAKQGSTLRPVAKVDETSKLGSDHFPFKINV